MLQRFVHRGHVSSARHLAAKRLPSRGTIPRPTLPHTGPTPLLALVFFGCSLGMSAQQHSGSQPLEVAAGVPLYIRTTQTVPLKEGALVPGVLTHDVFVGGRLVFPEGATVSGRVTAYAKIDRRVRLQALLNGDVTPLHDPVVAFEELHLQQTNTDIALDSTALIRESKVVRFAAKAQVSVRVRVESAVKEQVASARAVVFGSGKKDRALRFLYSQLPYHPQRIWAGTQFIADLDAPAEVNLPFTPDPAASDVESLDGISLRARLAATISSAFARKGDTVHGIITEPVLDSAGKQILKEGMALEGVVSQSKAARSFGRNGQLRFAIRGVQRAHETTEKVYGTITGTEGDKSANLTVDSEGNLKANPDPGRFLAPLLLAVTAAAGHDEDHHGGDGPSFGRTTVASNGFGLVARVLAVTVGNQNVASGFGAYAFAKSIYFRFVAKGHEVTFAKDTLIEVKLSTR